MDSLVSVIVPTYDRAYCLARAIDSALGQTHPRVEVLIIDDGSSDQTRQMVAGRYAHEPRVRYQYQENAGVVAARNNGLASANGAYIALLDSDDFWLPWKLELQLACMRERPEVGMVWTDMEAIDADGRVTDPAYLRTMYHAWRRVTAERLFGEGIPLGQVMVHASMGPPAGPAEEEKIKSARFYAGNVFSQMILGSLVHTSTVCLRRERLQRVKGFNTELKISGEDYDFHLRTCREGPVGFIDVSTIRYQTGLPDRLTRPTYELYGALNCLKTIAPLIESGRGVDLPRAVLRRRLAEVHEWIASAMFDRGDFAGARRHAVQSVRHCARCGYAWKLLVAACLPIKWVEAIQHARGRASPQRPETPA